MTKQEFWELLGRMVNVSLKSCKDCPLNKDKPCDISCGEALQKFYEEHISLDKL